jgi:hypothetical protein
MGFFDKFIPNEVKKPINKIVGGVSKITDKILPNELRFLAPYAAGIGTLMLPPGMGPLYRGLAGAGFNTLGQIASDETPIEDIDDLNALSIALAGGLGALGSDKITTGGESGMGIRKGNVLDEFGKAGDVYSDAAPTGFLQGVENVGREGIASLSDYVQGTRSALTDIGKNPGDLFKKTVPGMKGKFPVLKEAAGALGPTVALGTGDIAREAAIDIRDEQDRIDAEEAAEIEATTTANEQERADLQMQFMRQAGIPEETVEETLTMNDLGEYYTPPTESAANGGIIGLKEGGMLNFGGKEMDLRGGGFVPIGKKERADDVPARLSKNEFVMTADAVRAAGGGSINKGAQRMYDVMNKLEARV